MKKKAQKRMKKNQRKCLNALMRRFVSPKSSLMVFNELFGHVPIKVQNNGLNGIGMTFTATIEIYDQVFTGNHISKAQAKQIACEKCLRIMLANKMSGSSEIKEESPMKQDNMKDGDNGTVPKPKEPQHDDFPWSHFASLGMHKLINQWEIQSVSKAINLQEQSNFIISQTKASAMKEFPKDHKNFNPVK